MPNKEDIFLYLAHWVTTTYCVGETWNRETFWLRWEKFDLKISIAQPLTPARTRHAASWLDTGTSVSYFESGNDVTKSELDFSSQENTCAIIHPVEMWVSIVETHVRASCPIFKWDKVYV